MTEGLIGSALLALGVASLAGFKVGGIMADSLGARKTILIAIALQMAGLVCFSLLQQVSYGAVGALLIWAMFAWVFGLAVDISHVINKNGIVSLVGTKAPRVRYNTVFCLLVIIV